MDSPRHRLRTLLMSSAAVAALAAAFEAGRLWERHADVNGPPAGVELPAEVEPDVVAPIPAPVQSTGSLFEDDNRR
jgi:hypothetical protein